MRSKPNGIAQLLACLNLLAKALTLKESLPLPQKRMLYRHPGALRGKMLILIMIPQLISFLDSSSISSILGPKIIKRD